VSGSLEILSDIRAIERRHPKLYRVVTGHFDERGFAFFRELPERLERLAARWRLTLGEPFGDLSLNYVCRVTRADGTAAVLKVGVPEPEARNEATALRLLAGEGIVRLYESDPDEGALLMERLEPGDMLEPLSYTDDDAATLISAGVMRRLWRSAPADHGLWDLTRWFRALFRHRETHGGPGSFPPKLFDRAERVARELIDSTTKPVVLHGDLHHYNILRSDEPGRGGWLAIDPKGLVGDRGFEISAFIKNPEPKSPAVLGRRLDILCGELALDRKRVREWLFAEQMLNAAWDHDKNPHKCEQKVGRAELYLRI
jgi:streptomycin 6-kinase